MTKRRLSFEENKTFEKEGYNFLKKKFKKVEWLSERITFSPFDYAIQYKNKILFGDAKYSNKSPKPTLTKKQYDGDFIILGGKEKEFEFIWKKDFYKRVRFGNLALIKINIETKEMLDTLKNLGESYNAFIHRIIKDDFNKTLTEIGKPDKLLK